MDNVVESTVVKGGETCIQTTLGRSKDGMMVNIWAVPRVEDFVRSLGTGEQVDIQTIGRYWLPPEKHDENGKKIPSNEKKLFVYEYSNNITSYGDGMGFRLDRPGHPLIEVSDLGLDDGGLVPGRLYAKKGLPESLNMSFLRLVGISDPGGVSFVVKGVFSHDSIIRLGAQIDHASKKFYREFLKPFRLIVTTSIMQIPEGF